MKYSVGDEVYWVESSSNYQKSVPCPMCFGQRFVTIILGNDESEKIECGYCQKGYDRASGIATVWQPDAVVHKGTISGVTTRNGIKYEIGYKSIDEHELFNKKDDAEIEREKRYRAEVERSEKWFLDNFIQAKKKQIWSVGYHRRSIKDAEKTIAWHKSRLGMIKDKDRNGI